MLWHIGVLRHGVHSVDVRGDGRVILCDCGKLLGRHADSEPQARLSN
jgi:hypothetical protein